MNPDRIFIKMMDEAFKLALTDFTVICPDELDAELPNAHRNYSFDCALNTLKELYKYHKHADIWEINDYHYVLLYDILRQFSCIYNDLTKEDDVSEESLIKVGKIEIHEIDFEQLVEDYFPDTDFLLAQENLLGLSKSVKEQLGLSPETFGVVMGMKPHSEELKIKFYSKRNFEISDYNPGLFTPSSKIYPFVNEEG